MATAKIAETAKEFKTKYSRKRLTRKTAAKVYLFNYVYWALLNNENMPIDTVNDKVIKDESKPFDILMRDEYAAGLYSFYCGICVWINTAMESAVLIRNALLDFISHYTDIALTIEAGEKLRRTLGDQANNKDISSSLTWLTVDTYRPDGIDSHKITGLKSSIRPLIENYMRYLNVYNTLIETLGDGIEVPELSVFKVSTKSVERDIRLLNKQLNDVSIEIAKRETIQREEHKATSSTPGTKEWMEEKLMAFEPNSIPQPFTQTELDEVLKAFAPMEEKAPPIPEENIEKARRMIKELDQAAHPFNGDSFFKAMSNKYWRR